jgi:hypothetical protein
MLATFGAASGYISVAVLALYINDPSTAELYRHPQFIWLACPLMLYWVSRAWLMAHRGKMHDDPVVFAMKDRISLIVGVLILIAFAFAI